MRTRKGTEKPIEIFVALFIILAVALVMLKLFQSQIAQKQKDLSDVQQEAKAQELKNKVQLACQQKCTDASNNGCSLASRAALCAFSSKNVLKTGESLDLNNDNLPNYDDTFLAGVGVCEDRVYCFNNLISSCCGFQITPQNCQAILTDYWDNEAGIGSETIGGMETGRVPFTDGACIDADLDGNEWPALTG